MWMLVVVQRQAMRWQKCLGRLSCCRWSLVLAVGEGEGCWPQLQRDEPRGRDSAVRLPSSPPLMLPPLDAFVPSMIVPHVGYVGHARLDAVPSHLPSWLVFLEGGWSWVLGVVDPMTFSS